MANVKDFWNAQAKEGNTANSRDFILKRLEIEAIAKHVEDGMRVLDVGCGTGETLLELARRFDFEFYGTDFSEKMIAQAKRAYEHNEKTLKGFGFFICQPIERLDILLSHSWSRFDLIFSERAIINLPDWPAQEQAIRNICGLLKPGGKYVMCEHSQEGLDYINDLRQTLGLSAIVPPWHNRYLLDAEVNALDIPGVRLVEIDDFSGTYYWLSRVVNAALAAEEGREPAYDSPINKLALRLPSSSRGQGRIWIWRKEE